MRDFNLFLDIQGDWVLVSTPLDAAYSMPFSTYEEKLDEQEHNQYTLTFSVAAKTITDEENINPLLQYYCIGNKMHLVLDGGKRIDLVIKDIVPSTRNANATYNITAQDEVSFLWSKHNVGYSYSTLTEDGILTAKNIFTIAQEVLEDNYLTDWGITSQSLDYNLADVRFVLETSNSNPYNTLIEACNTVNALMFVNYHTKKLDFMRKDLVGFSGYRYTPNKNLTSYSASYSGEELTTMLHVNGGTDAYGQQVSIVPPMPFTVRSVVKNILENNDTELSLSSSWDDFKVAADNELIAWEPRYAFVPLSYYEIDNNRYQISGQDYITRYNDIDGKYYGEIAFYDGTKDKNYYSFVIKPDDSLWDDSENHDTITTDGVHVKCGSVQLTHYKNGQEDGVITGVIYQAEADRDKYKKEAYNKLQTEHNNFFIVAKVNNYLGHSLIDLSPFLHLMRPDERSGLDTLINIIWRKLNIQLQYYTYEFYSGVTLLTSLRNKIVNYATLYSAECEHLQDALAANRDSVKDVDFNQHYAAIKEAESNLKNVIINSDYFRLIKELGISEELDIQGNCYTYYFEKEQQLLQEQLNQYKKERAELFALTENDTTDSAERQYYDQQINTLQSLCGHFVFTAGSRDYAPGAYPLIIDIIANNIPEELASVGTGIAYQYEKIQRDIEHQVYAILYQNYGRYIYEQSYDNPDEIDSVNLFKQASIHFADLNRARTSHSLEAFDIGELECINIPRLSVGSLIQVYNDDNIKAAPYAHILNQIKKHKALLDYTGETQYLTKLEELSQELEYLYFYFNKNDFEQDIAQQFMHQCNVIIRADGAVGRDWNGVYKVDYYKKDYNTITIVANRARRIQISFYLDLREVYNIQGYLSYKLSMKNLIITDGTEQFEGLSGFVSFESVTPPCAEIIDKLYTDEILVTGISRVLREPFKDSVTVEQPSRYKTILSKLIKSI